MRTVWRNAANSKFSVLLKALTCLSIHLQVKNLTNKHLQVIPHGGNNSSVTKLLIEGNQITLNELNRLALASYPRLEELHLDGNLVISIPAKYFSDVPYLKVLSLSRNQINR